VKLSQTVLRLSEVYDMEAMEEVTSVVPVPSCPISNFSGLATRSPGRFQNVGVATRPADLWRPVRNALSQQECRPAPRLSVAVIKTAGTDAIGPLNRCNLRATAAAMTPRFCQENILQARRRALPRCCKHVPMREMRTIRHDTRLSISASVLSSPRKCCSTWVMPSSRL
jgi:hypothetical protein